MKEFLAGFQVDTENKALAGVCAGLGNYFNIQANILNLTNQIITIHPRHHNICNNQIDH